jgi:hypothetical protein
LCGDKITDIRGFYKYKFIKNQQGKILLQLQKKIGDVKKTLILSKNNNSVQNPIELKYGKIVDGNAPLYSLYKYLILGIYQHKKLPLNEKKQHDTHNLSKFCTNLSTEELNYWYPPCNYNISEDMETQEEKEEEAHVDLSTDLQNLCSNEQLQQFA